MYPQTQPVGAKTTSIDPMNAFLRGEISAVETYRQCLEKLGTDNLYYRELQENLQSHQRRVDLLRGWIVQHGGKPSEGSGVWGGFAKLLEGGAKAFGDKAAISVLEEGEDHGRNDYERDLKQLDAEARRFVETKILPEQRRTHDTLSRIEKNL